MKNLGGGHRAGHVVTDTILAILYKGGPVNEGDDCKEGPCTVKLSVSDAVTSDVCLCVII